MLVLILFAAMTVAIFWPQLWSPDTQAQIRQAQAGRFEDHHPPIMSLLMVPFVRLSAPNALIIVQAATFWSTAYLVLRSFERPSARRTALALLPVLLPSSVAIIGVMWKDVHLALAWGLGWALILMSRVSRRKNILLATAAVFVIYGLLLRHNAFIAVPPLVLMLFTGKPWLKRWYLTALAYGAIALSSFGFVQLVNYEIIGAERVGTAQMSLPIFDLAGITVASGSNAFPFDVNDEQMDQIRSCYRPVRWDSLYYLDSPCRWLMAGMMEYSERGGSVHLSWLQAIVDNPAAYLQHRSSFVGSFLTYEYEGGWETHQASYGSDWSKDPVLLRRPILLAYSVYVEKWERLGLMDPTVVLVWSLLLAWVCWSRRVDKWSTILGAVIVALLNVLSHVPFGVASDQRYAYPSFVLLAYATAAALLRYRSHEEQQSRTNSDGITC